MKEPLMTGRTEWEGRVGRKWAEEWRRTDRSFAGLTDRLLGRVAQGGPRAVLDVGCGAGELSLAFARGHPAATVYGIDVSASLVDAARERGHNLANVSFECADAARWSLDGFAPELVMSRHGVMFFDDPVAAFAHLSSISAPDGRLVFSCFRSVEENAWAHEVARLVSSAPPLAPDPRAPGPFAFADPEYVEEILSASGWSEIGFEPVDFAYVAGAGDDAVGDALSYLQSIGPASRAAAELPAEARVEFIERLRGYLEGVARDGLVALPAAAWIVSAAKA
jgi:SAM-dependent methyltransferase